MAAAYHMEALRKQRVVDKAAAAKRKAGEEVMVIEAATQTSSISTPKRSRAITDKSDQASQTYNDSKTIDSRPSSKSSTKSSMKDAFSKTGSTKGSTRDAVTSRGSRTGSQSGSRVSTVSGSRPVSKSSHSPSEGSRPQTTESHLPTEESSTGTRPHSKAGSYKSSTGGSRVSTASNNKSTTSKHGAGSVSSRLSNSSYSSSKKRSKGEEEEMDPRVLSKVEAVKRDLHEQEMILRDSNLVMGHISPQDVMTSA